MSCPTLVMAIQQAQSSCSHGQSVSSWRVGTSHRIGSPSAFSAPLPRPHQHHFTSAEPHAASNSRFRLRHNHRLPLPLSTPAPCLDGGWAGHWEVVLI